MKGNRSDGAVSALSGPPERPSIREERRLFGRGHPMKNHPVAPGAGRVEEESSRGYVSADARSGSGRRRAVTDVTGAVSILPPAVLTELETLLHRYQVQEHRPGGHTPGPRFRARLHVQNQL